MYRAWPGNNSVEPSAGVSLLPRVRAETIKYAMLIKFQFSLVDIRPLYAMAEVCIRHNVKLLTYGTVVRYYPLRFHALR